MFATGKHLPEATSPRFWQNHFPKIIVLQVVGTRGTCGSDLDNSGDDEFVKAGDIDNVENNDAQNNYAHEGTGAGGEKSPQGGANSDAAEGTSEGTSGIFRNINEWVTAFIKFWDWIDGVMVSTLDFESSDPSSKWPL